MSCQRFNIPEYCGYQVSPTNTVAYFDLPVKMCQLVRGCGCTLLYKVVGLVDAAASAPSSFRTACGATIPLVAASTGAAVSAGSLTLNTWYQIQIRCNDGVAQATVQIL